MTRHSLRNYYELGPHETECHSCGEHTTCQIYVSRYPETETGYVDEVALCAICDPYSPDYEPPQSLAQRTMVITAEDPDFA